MIVHFSAIAATDILTCVDAAGAAVAHGLNSGDGAAQALVAGPNGVLAGLDESLDYYAYRIDATTFKLSDTAAHAIAGTNFIDITSNINGQLGFNLPFRRARTYVATSQVKSADLNSFQDDDIGKRHGLVKVALAPKIVNNVVGVSWQQDAADTVTSTGAGTALFDVPCEVGDTICGVEILAFGNGAADAQIDLTYLSAAMAPTTIASFNDVNRAAAWGFAVASGLGSVAPSAGGRAAHKMVSGERLRLSIAANAAAYSVAQIKLIKHRGE